MDKQQLVDKYKNLIFKVIKDVNCHYSNEDEWQDYYDAGMLGLLQGINKFNPEREETTTYFINCIRHNILRLFYSNSRMVRKINYIEKDSLDSENKNERELHEVIADPNINIENQIIKEEQYEILYKAINMLKPEYKDIVCKFYGIQCRKLTLEEMSAEYKITRQAISAKKNCALKDLRKYMKRLGGIDIE